MRVDGLRRARAMRCMACGEEMRLTRVVRDETCERHTLHCMGCEEVERPLVLLAPRHGASAKDNQADQTFAPSGAWARAVAALRGRQRTMGKLAAGAKTKANWDREFSQLGTSPFRASDFRDRPDGRRSRLTARSGAAASVRGACGSTRRKRKAVRSSLRYGVRPGYQVVDALNARGMTEAAGAKRSPCREAGRFSQALAVGCRNHL